MNDMMEVIEPDGERNLRRIDYVQSPKGPLDMPRSVPVMVKGEECRWFVGSTVPQIVRKPG